MDKLLWLIVVFRLCRLLLPFALGLAGAVIFSRHIVGSAPPGWGLWAFLGFALYLGITLANEFSTGKHSRGNQGHRRRNDNE